ncbi:MAG: glycosyltransferase [Planctomycetes bacterium]|nr:glycosyltransferase [Planctomycetota bacterium]
MQPTPPTILHVVHSLECGGTERMLVALLNAFDPTAFRHVVVTMRAPGPLAAAVPDHTAVVPMNARGPRRFAGLALARIARRNQAVLIHARNTGCWFDATLARLTGLRTGLILGFHGCQDSGPLGASQRRKARLAMRAGARFACVSQSGREQLETEAGIPGARISVIPNGVDKGVFGRRVNQSRSATRNAFGFRHGDIVVGIVGSLTPVKGHAILLRAFASAIRSQPQLHLLIVGDGLLRGELVEQVLALRLGEHVRFAGQIDNVPAVLAGFDMYVCASHSEGMSNALLEAMAAGLPIIATDVGDNARVLRDGVDGRIVAAADVDRLASEIVVLARDPDKRRTFAAAARARVDRFDFAECVRAYERLYASFVPSERHLWPSHQPVHGQATKHTDNVEDARSSARRRLEPMDSNSIGDCVLPATERRQH